MMQEESKRSEIQSSEQAERDELISKDKDFSYYIDVLYDLCKREYPDLITMVKLFVERGKNEYDNQIAIEGVTGSGKSMFTFIVMLLFHKMAKIKFSFKDNIVFIPDEGELKRIFKVLPKYSALWVDEAIRALDKKQWYRQDQIDLNHIVKTERFNFNTVFYLMPNFAEFSNSFRTHNIYFRVYIIPRYAAVLHIKDIDKDVEDPWHTKINKRIKFGKIHKDKTYFKYKAVIPNFDRLESERKLPNYWMDTEFPNIQEIPQLAPLWEMYEEAKRDSRRRLQAKKEEEDEHPANRTEQKYRKVAAIALKALLQKSKKSKDKLRKELKLPIAYETFCKITTDE